MTAIKEDSHQVQNLVAGKSRESRQRPTHGSPFGAYRVLIRDCYACWFVHFGSVFRLGTLLEHRFNPIPVA